MAVLDDLQIVLGVTDQDNLLNLYIRKAVTLITIYLNMKPAAPAIDIAATYPDAVIEYVTICMNKRGTEGLKQFTQGSRNGTYGNDLPDSVKALLPPPFVTMLRSTPYPTVTIND